MRESRSYGSVRGACDETHVPTATAPRVHHASRRRGSRMAALPAMPVIGFLNSVSAGPFRQFVDAFRRGLNESGFVEGQNVMIDYRWAEGQYGRLPELAADMVRRNVAVIVATGGAPRDWPPRRRPQRRPSSSLSPTRSS